MPTDPGRAGLEPIRVACEGARHEPIRTAIDPASFSYNGGFYVGMCQMCGRFVNIDDDGLLVAHDRDDVLAMIDRGDFG